MIRTCLATFLCLALVAGPAHTAIKTWNAGGGEWSDSLAWSPPGVPASTDTVIIDNDARVLIDVAITLEGDVTIGALDTLVVDRYLNIPVEAAATVTCQAGGVLQMSGGTLTCAGTLDNYGQVHIDDPNVAFSYLFVEGLMTNYAGSDAYNGGVWNMRFGGSLVHQSGATITTSYNFAVQASGTIENYGYITNFDRIIVSGTTLTNHPGGTIETHSVFRMINQNTAVDNYGDIDVLQNGDFRVERGVLTNYSSILASGNPAKLQAIGQTAYIVNDSSGTITLTAPGELVTTVGGTLDNYGLISNNGAVRTGGFFNDYGIFDNFQLFEINFAFYEHGYLHNRSSATITSNHGLTVSAGGLLQNDGMLQAFAGVTVNDTLRVGATGSIDIQPSGWLQVYDALVNDGGVITNSSSTLGGFYGVRNYGTFLNSGGTFTNDGGISLEGGSYIVNGGAIDGTGTWYCRGGTINNNLGTLAFTTMWADSGIALNGTVTNNGDLFVQPGQSLLVTGTLTCTNDAEILATDGASIDNAGGTINLMGNYATLHVLNGASATTMTNSGTIYVDTGPEYWKDATLRNSGVFTNLPGGLIQVQSGMLENVSTVSGTSLINQGEIRTHGDVPNQVIGDIVNHATIENHSLISANGTFTNSGTGLLQNDSLLVNAGAFTNDGTVQNNAIFINACAGTLTDNGTWTGNPAQVSPCFWDGEGDGVSWSDPLNWSGDQLPSTSNDIVIDAPGSTIHMDMYLAFADTVSMYPLTNVVVDSGITVADLGSGRIRNYGTMTNYGHLEGISNELDATFVNGAGAMLECTAAFINEGSAVNYGVFETDGLGITNDGFMINEGGGVIRGDGPIYNNGQLDNFGRIEISGKVGSPAGTFLNYGTFANEDSLITDGQIVCYGETYNYGYMENRRFFDTQWDGIFVADGATLWNPGEINNLAELNISAAGTLDNAGTLVNSCAGDLRVLGSLVGNPAIDVACIWDGGGDGVSWSDPLNWDSDLLPAASKEVRIESGANVTLDMLYEQQGIFALGATDTLVIPQGGRLHVQGTTEIGGWMISATGDPAGQPLQYGLIVYDSLHIAPGGLLSNSGTVQITSSGRIVVGGTFAALSGQVKNEGLTHILTEGRLTNDGECVVCVAPIILSGEIRNDGVFDVHAPTEVVTSGVIQNHGRLDVFNDGIPNNQLDDGSVFGNGSLNNCGTVSGWTYVTVSVQQQNCDPLYVVNTTDDTNDGLCDSLHCSLREAIEASNAEAGLGRIAFDIPGSGPHVIAPASTLPAVTGKATIEGYWQAGSFRNTAPWGSAGNASIMIQLDGTSVISGNGLDIQADSCEVRGLSIVNFPGSGIAVGANLCVVEGNYLGLDAVGTSAGPNGNGISFGAGSTGHRIGGTSATMRNVISGNSQEGIWFAGNNSSSLVEGNLVGPLASVDTGPGNGASGIAIENGLNNTIGGTGTGAGNIIAFNGANGVAVLGASALGNSILGNSTHSNVNQSIDLGGDLLTANDTGDIDIGSNGLQNFPDLGTAFFSDSVHVTGNINAKPGAVARIEFFATGTPDPPLSHGEGSWFLGAVDGVVFQSGSTPINAAVSLPSDPTVRYITATATTNEGTSEFSLCVAGQNTATGSNVVIVPEDSTTGEMPVTLTFDEVTTPGFTTLVTSPEGPLVLYGGRALEDKYYNMDTDAVHTGVTIAIQYDDSWFSCSTCNHGFESDIALIHWDDALIPPAWVDITTSVDTVANVAYGYASTGLSPFVVYAPHLVTGIRDVPVVPAQTALYPNVPNPFNPTTTITYDVPSVGTWVTIEIFNVRGQRVTTLVDEPRPVGRHRVRWLGMNHQGTRVATGVYFCRMSATGNVHTIKMVLIK